MMTTKAYRTWLGRLESGVLTKSQIQQFGAAVTRHAYGETPNGKRSALTGLERGALFTMIQAEPIRLTPEHTERALAWLTRYGRKLLGMSEADHARVTEGFDHFSWDGEAVLSGRSTLAIWTVHLRDGSCLKYFSAPWQSHYDTGYRHTAYWWDGDRPPVTDPEGEPVMEFPVSASDDALSADAHRVSDLVDRAVEDWENFVHDMKARSKRLRERR